jgi:hypothetical protein
MADKRYKLIQMTNGRVGIEAPFNVLFVERMKTMVPSQIWNAKHSLRTFDKESLPTVEALAAEFFPAEWVTHRITWVFSDKENLYFDKTESLYVNRDSWKWRDNPNVAIRVLEIGLRSGGSRKNPTISGCLVAEVSARPGIVISPEPKEMVAVTPEPKEESTPEPLSGDLRTQLAVEYLRKRLAEIHEGVAAGIEWTDSDRQALQDLLEAHS